MSRNKTVSYSQYSIYKQCPHRWYLEYVKKLKIFKPSVHLIFGTALHETLQNYLRVMYEDSATAADKIHLPTYFKIKFIELYKQNSTIAHFSSPEELSEFFEDAIAILDFIEKKRTLYFKKKNCELIGIEIPISGTIVEGIETVKMKGYIDLVLYDRVLDKYIIYDIKTSTRGWSDYEKKDQAKLNQILLYKRYFSVLRGIPEDKIDVQFFIVRRKINENLDFVPKRVQEFVPAHGVKKVKSAFEDLQSFVKDGFTLDGEYQEKVYPKDTGSCKYCPFINRLDLCDRKNS